MRQSDEGGRFFRDIAEYRIIDTGKVQPGAGTIQFTLSEMACLLPQGIFNNEARFRCCCHWHEHQICNLKRNEALLPEAEPVFLSRIIFTPIFLVCGKMNAFISVRYPVIYFPQRFSVPHDLPPFYRTKPGQHGLKAESFAIMLE